MTGKRYYAHKHLINEDKVHDKICHRFMNITETVEHMNMYYQKYTALKKENNELKKEVSRVEALQILRKLEEENEQLKEELDYWKKRALLLENKYNEGDSIKWLRENTVWEQMPSNKRTFTKTTKE